MNKKTLIVYYLAFLYELIKFFHTAHFLQAGFAEPSPYTYSALAALCIPALLWLMLLLNQQDFRWAMYALVIFKFTTVCAALLYIFNGEFAIMGAIVNSAQRRGGSNSILELLFPLIVDMILLGHLYSSCKTPKT